MKLLRRIANILLRRDHSEIIPSLHETDKLDNNFVFPYSTDKNIKRQQIWDNLQKGLLLEDKKVLIPWLTSFDQVDNLTESRNDGGGSTLWYLGRSTILDGYVGHFHIKKWQYLPWSNPITEISQTLGQDDEGLKEFRYLREYITNLLGDPKKVDLEDFNSFELGVIQWENGLVKLKLEGIEHFACKYSFTLGLVRDRNEEFLRQAISELSEYEYGK